MSAASDHGPASITDYIVHHLTNLTVGEGFWTFHLDTLFFSIVLGGLFAWVFYRAAQRASVDRSSAPSETVNTLVPNRA